MHLLDWIVVLIYLGTVIALGLWMGRKDKNMEDYFLGGRNIPWFAALLSMVATEISAATFLGAPEQGYVRDLTYLQFGIGSILARFALAFFFLGVFYKLRVYTVYGFLTQRFGVPSKNATAGMFLLGRFFAGGSRLFIASLAVKVVTGFDFVYAIVILGSIAIVYTLFGGIKAVIWTDVVQAVILAGGAVFSIVYLLGEIPMGSSGIWSMLMENEKLRLFDTRTYDAAGGLAIFSNAYHFLPAIVGGFFLTMATHGTDQAMIQRLLTCKDSTRAKLSMVGSGFLGIGVTVLFLIVGLLLFVYAQALAPESEMGQIAANLKETGHNGDFFLHFIIQRLPVGISGLLIASVIAAAMSSIDSELNAMASTFVNDFYQPYTKVTPSNAKLMKVAKIATVVAGMALIGTAVLIADFYKKNPDTDLLSIALGVMTFFYGGMLGIFLLGLFSRNRGSSLTNVLALVTSTVILIFTSYKTKILTSWGWDQAADGSFAHWLFGLNVSWPWYTVMGVALTVAIAAIGKTTISIADSYENKMNSKSEPEGT